MNDLDQYKNNNSFCAVPFVSMMVNTDTTIRYCCMVKGTANKIRKTDGTFYHCQDNFIKDAWNSSDMKTIRLNMIQGNKIEGCSVCYLQEESGRVSNRQHANREWSYRLGADKLVDLIQQAENNQGQLADDIVYLDLRLGNLCNLKCRMCNPWNSSQIAKEHMVLNNTDSAYAEVWKKTFGKFPISVLENQSWFESDILWDQVIALIPSLKKVYMTGGEPTLIEHNQTFMQSCIDQGRTDIELFFNTNCTNINKRFLELIKQFSTVSINASVDGVGIVNEYIRPPSRWSQLSSNIEKLAQMPNVKLGLTPTVQVYNILNLVDVLRYVDQLNDKYRNNIFVDFLINVHPYHLSATILPDHIKLRARQQLENYVDLEMSSQTHELTKNSIRGIVGLLQKTAPEDCEEQVRRLRIYTESLDRERAQSSNDLGPELREFLHGKI